MDQNYTNGPGGPYGEPGSGYGPGNGYGPGQAPYGQPGNGYGPGNPYGRWTKTTGIVSLVFGVLALIFFCGNIVAVIFGAVAVVTGIVQLVKNRRFGVRGQKAMPVAGIICGIAGAVLGIIFLYLVATGVGAMLRDMTENGEDYYEQFFDQFGGGQTQEPDLPDGGPKQL